MVPQCLEVLSALTHARLELGRDRFTNRLGDLDEKLIGANKDAVVREILDRKPRIRQDFVDRIAVPPQPPQQHVERDRLGIPTVLGGGDRTPSGPEDIDEPVELRCPQEAEQANQRLAPQDDDVGGSGVEAGFPGMDLDDEPGLVRVALADTATRGKRAVSDRPLDTRQSRSAAAATSPRRARPPRRLPAVG